VTATLKFGIGQAITRREDDRLLTGQGRFVDDLGEPGDLHLAFVRSPHAHARVASIDTAEALACPGVVAVLTGADLVADKVGGFPPNPALKNAAGRKMSTPPCFALATDAVRALLS
jgi:carbon-monoxide dehydrogenase large subunit